MLKNYTPIQHKIRDEWRFKHRQKQIEKEQEYKYKMIEQAFYSLANK